MMLVGIATLLVGSVGSVVKADDHKYLYLFSGISHRNNHNVLAVSVSGRRATLNIEVTDRYARNVGSDATVTIEPGYMQRLLLPDAMTGNGSGDRFRTVRIVSNEKLWIMVRRSSDTKVAVVPVYEQVIPCSDKTHPCDTKS